MQILESLLTIDAVAQLAGVSKSTIRRLAQDPANSFPKPLRIGPNCIRWHPEEVRDWLADLRQRNSAA